MSFADRIRQATKNPKVIAGAGAAVVAVVLIARGGGSSSSSTSDVAPAADPFGYGAGLTPAGGYSFGGADMGLVDSDDNKALHDRFDLLEDTLAGTNLAISDNITATSALAGSQDTLSASQSALAGIIGGISQTIADLQSQRVSVGTAPDAAPPSPSAPPPVTPPVSQVTTRPPTPAAPSGGGGGFDRSAIAWKSLYLAKSGGGKQAVEVAKLSDDQIRNALGNGFNNGALASGWVRLASGAVVRG